MLTARITDPPPANPEVEDIFSSGLNVLFPDYTQNSHGIPGGTIIYTSPTHGPLTLRIPAHPDVEEGRRLFAHYLWNAAVVAADLIEAASRDESNPQDPFNVSGKSVLELGAGTALPSLICALSNASRVVITDHPNSPSITTDAIISNVQDSLFSKGTPAKTAAKVDVRGYVWGEPTFWSPSKYGRPLPDTKTERFDRLLMCDCLWMPSQHRNLVSSATQWLNANAESSAIVVAGFHTGRSIVSSFFSTAAGEDTDGRGTSGGLRIAEIYEIDVDGTRREWQSERAEETKEQAKRWCVVGVLKRR